jgi:prepilin-type N-terminal cleavage/methylation domain-containing protein/prepilin-type processing-associated H-X9-DG protein
MKLTTLQIGRSGFTLAEMLVVLVVITILASLLLPAISRGKAKARDVHCKSNLKQWGIVWRVYAEENGNSFSSGTSATNWARGDWLLAIMSSHQRKPDLLLCPSATSRRGPGEREVKVSPGSSQAADWGGPTTAWASPLPDPQNPSRRIISSYALNSWAYNPPFDLLEIQGRPTAFNWRKLDAPSDPSNTPMFLDAMWRGGGPFPTDPPPAFNGEWAGINAEFHHFAIARHNKGVNVVFFDGSVRYLPARDLWNLPWHNQYDTQYATRNIQFPSWMK